MAKVTNFVQFKNTLADKFPVNSPAYQSGRKIAGEFNHLLKSGCDDGAFYKRVNQINAELRIYGIVICLK